MCIFIVNMLACCVFFGVFQRTGFTLLTKQLFPCFCLFSCSLQKTLDVLAYRIDLKISCREKKDPLK